MDPILKFVHAELGYRSRPGFQSVQQVLVPPAPPQRSRGLRAPGGRSSQHIRGFDTPGGGVAIPPTPMNVGFLTQEKWWYDDWNPEQTSLGMTIRVSSGHMAFVDDFMQWSSNSYFRDRVTPYYQMSSVPDLTPGMVSGPGYGWGEFVVPGSGGIVHLTMAAAHFQALALAFCGDEQVSPNVKVTWTLSNDANGADIIMGQQHQSGTVPILPNTENQQVIHGPGIVNGRLWRAQPVAREVHLRMWVSESNVPVRVFVVGVLGHLS